MIHSLAAIFDRLPIAGFALDIKRNDELSGQGSGAVIGAELAPPLWSAIITLGDGRNNELKQAAALIRSLGGVRDAFMVADPTSLWPQADFRGAALAGKTIKLRTIGANHAVALLYGFPAGYTMTLGDKIQFTDGGRISYHEVRTSVSATAGGALDLPVYPMLPFSLTTNAVVTLIRPAFPAIVVPTGHKPGEASSAITRGARIEIIEKRKAS